MYLTDAQKEALENFGALNYDARRCAILLEVDIIEFSEMFDDENSEIRVVYDKGKYKAEFEIDSAILADAKEGKMNAITYLKKRKEEDEWKAELSNTFGEFPIR